MLKVFVVEVTTPALTEVEHAMLHILAPLGLWSFRGNPSVHVAVRPGGLFDVELVHLQGGKRLSGDERSDVPVEMTPAGHPHLEPIEAVLPLPDVQLRAEA